MSTYLLTGATGGIGGAIARLLGEAGHDLMGTVRSQDRARDLPPSVAPLVIDLQHPGRIAAAVSQIRHLDGIVHCAALPGLGVLSETSVDDWTGTLAVNLVSAAELTRVLLPLLRRARGHVIFLNSRHGQHIIPGSVAYTASKHALGALAAALREEEPALRVTSVYPGATATRMQQTIRDERGEPYEPEKYSDPQTVAQEVINILQTPGDSVINEVSIRN